MNVPKASISFSAVGVSPAISPSLPLPLHKDKLSRRIHSQPYSHMWEHTPRPHTTHTHLPSALSRQTQTFGRSRHSLSKCPAPLHSPLREANSLFSKISNSSTGEVLGRKKLQLNEGHLTVSSKEKQIFITSI